MMATPQSVPAAVFGAAGLQAGRAHSRARANGNSHKSAPGERFRECLDSLGGLYSLFGEYLNWRADLLRSESLRSLQSVRRLQWTLDCGDAAAMLQRDLGQAGQEAANGLEQQPCWRSGFRCAYRCRFGGRDVVVQFGRPGFDAREWSSFEGTMLGLDEDALEAVLNRRVFAQFREWVRLNEAAGRERRLLEAIDRLRSSVATVFPAPVPELCSESILAYEWVPGTGLDVRDEETLHKLCESILEQMCLFSVVDPDLDHSRYVLTPSGEVALRFPSRFIAVPAVHLRPMLKYISSVLANNVPGAAHSLLRMAGDESGSDAQMLDALSAIEPDLKVNLPYPASAALFETQWRALARLRPNRPLFLDCMHRNLIALGYWMAQSPGRTSKSADLLEQAHWPVLGRLLRMRLGELMTREAASDWLVGSGLLMMEGLRQINRIAEDLRDDDLSVRVQVAGAGNAHAASGDQTAALIIVCGLLLAAFLLCLRWGAAASGGLSTLLAVGAVVAAVGLYLTVSRLE